MKKLSMTLATATLLLSALFLIAWNYSVNDEAENKKYAIASVEYEDLAEKALRSIEKFQFNELYGMVSDDIEYYLPDGGEKSRTSFIGKNAFIEFWNSYQEKSGNDKLTLTNTVHIPVIVKEKLNYSKITGVTVVSYFSMDMQYGEESIDMRMNWGFHFNENKKIDKIYSYYDRTPIIEAAKRNLLDKEDK